MVMIGAPHNCGGLLSKRPLDLLYLKGTMIEIPTKQHVNKNAYSEDTRAHCKQASFHASRQIPPPACVSYGP